MGVGHMKAIYKAMLGILGMVLIVIGSSVATQAAFTFDSVPPNFNFGTVTYPANAPISRSLTSGVYNLQVTDTRSLLFTNGYRVTVTAPKLTGTNNPANNVMRGNNIRLQAGLLSQIGGILGLAPTITSDFYADAVDANGNSLATTVLLAPRGTILVGLLTWIAQWPPSNITFNMSTREANVDLYTTTITWTLYDAP